MNIIATITGKITPANPLGNDKIKVKVERIKGELKAEYKGIPRTPEKTSKDASRKPQDRRRAPKTQDEYPDTTSVRMKR